MVETTLHLQEPAESVSASASTLQGNSAERTELKRRAPVWQRVAWWLSLAVMLPVGLGVLQMLALLVQAERVRGMLESTLAVASLPHASMSQVCDQTEAALRAWKATPSYLLISHNGDRIREIRYSGPMISRIQRGLINGLSGGNSHPTIQESDLISAEVIFPARNLLPVWLGPPVPWIVPDEVPIYWHATVGQD